MYCAQIMKKRVDRVSPETTVQEAARRMRDGCFGLLPVCDADERLLGVVTDRDLALRVCAEGKSCESTPVEQVMVREVLCCGPEDSLARAEELMARSKKSRILVLDTQGRLRGLISLTDIAQCEEPLRVARLLREITARQYRIERSSGCFEQPASSARTSVPDRTSVV